MKTWKSLVLVAIVVVFGIAGFIGCDNDPDPKPTTYTVTFDSNGGSAVSKITGLKSGAKITAPTTPTKDNDLAGLYKGTPDNYTFDGWYNGTTAWDFTTDTVTKNITLTAKWTAPTATPIDLSGVEGNNILAKTFAYIKNNFTDGDTHTLLLDTNLENAEIITCDYACNLTLIGIGEPRTITRSDFIFLLSNNDASITLGKNITLHGSNSTKNVVHAFTGTFTMLDGSKISGGECGIWGTNRCHIFIKDGEISDYQLAGIVLLDTQASLTLSGNAVVGSVVLIADPTKSSAITFDSDWNGSIDIYLTLFSDPPGTNDYWNNKTVIQAESGYTLSTSDIAKIKSVCFWNGIGDPVNTSDTHQLVLDTANNVIKLVVKQPQNSTLIGFVGTIPVWRADGISVADGEAVLELIATCYGYLSGTNKGLFTEKVTAIHIVSGDEASINGTVLEVGKNTDEDTLAPYMRNVALGIADSIGTVGGIPVYRADGITVADGETVLELVQEALNAFDPPDQVIFAQKVKTIQIVSGSTLVLEGTTFKVGTDVSKDDLDAYLAFDIIYAD